MPIRLPPGLWAPSEFFQPKRIDALLPTIFLPRKARKIATQQRR